MLTKFDYSIFKLFKHFLVIKSNKNHKLYDNVSI